MEFLAWLLKSTYILHLSASGIDLCIEEGDRFHWVADVGSQGMVARRVPKQEDFGCPDKLVFDNYGSLKAGIESFREVLRGLTKLLP